MAKLSLAGSLRNQKRSVREILGQAAKNLTKKLPDLRLVGARQGGFYEGFQEISISRHVGFGAPTAKTLG
jgi:hypothetical protein